MPSSKIELQLEIKSLIDSIDLYFKTDASQIQTDIKQQKKAEDLIRQQKDLQNYKNLLLKHQNFTGKLNEFLCNLMICHNNDFFKFVENKKSAKYNRKQIFNVYAKLRKILHQINSYPEHDIVYLDLDPIFGGGIFQVVDYGYRLINVGLTLEDLWILKSQDGSQYYSIVDPDCILNYLIWFDSVINGNFKNIGNFAKFKHKKSLKFNGNRYRPNKNGDLTLGVSKKLKTFTVQGVHLSRNILPQPCKFFIKFGKCTNSNCSFIHDPSYISLCRSFFISGYCHHQQNCNTLHSDIGNEYIVPHCTKYWNGECLFTYGAESNFANGDSLPLIPKDQCCKYIHKCRVIPQYPSCRQFSHLGYCYRGLNCKFPHLWACADDHSFRCCFLKNCKYPHVEMNSIANKKKSESGGVNVYDEIFEEKTLNLLKVDFNDFLIPLGYGMKKLILNLSTSEHWYGLKKRELSHNIPDRIFRNADQNLVIEKENVVQNNGFANSSLDFLKLPSSSESSEYEFDDDDD
ncbi:uncharacterized protein SCODWIG_03935 [Saccharomycodes ludwigii]|uniref:C3H1-type domain-containing protein n=1 Tax=Saccharomycodes ludwigii TaxID=36035 RepID=A0A376BBV8_9ASCO|nr:hypothetical protein SCDLUD_003656 [Saccharomycodes ludwigii]KAH3900659.1 hypothetical protein SCDLUD_003656 [Saccharomycodes ludwigii]SSD62173.1 uncharacterized protein SCODWIG_03935 [Saccharomycodes ludwigii]